jgi:hypothetical protein
VPLAVCSVSASRGRFYSTVLFCRVCVAFTSRFTRLLFGLLQPEGAYLWLLGILVFVPGIIMALLVIVAILDKLGCYKTSLGTRLNRNELPRLSASSLSDGRHSDDNSGGNGDRKRGGGVKGRKGKQADSDRISSLDHLEMREPMLAGSQDDL